MRRSGLVLAVLSLSIASLLVGGQCDPTERPCNNPGACGESEYPACIQYCVPQVPRDEALGMPCVADPCDPDLVSAGTAILCPTGLSCVPFGGSSQGVCLDLHQAILGACEPQVVNTCASGLFCRPFEGEECPGNPERPSGVSYYAGAGGVCAPPIREGGFCDANWGQQGCRVCEPGTQCTPDPERGGSLRCRRTCDLDDDCPCTEGADPSVCLGDMNAGDGEHDGFCSVCVPHHGECQYRAPNPDMDELCLSNPDAPGCFEWLSLTPYGCCAAEDECRRVSVGGGSAPSLDTGVCCAPSAACETNADCCPSDLCNTITNECQPCDGPGEMMGVGCCEGLEPREGVCRPECDPMLENTECDLCQGVDEVWTCTDETGLECLPVEPPGGDDSTCDGVDDDCDGDIDEDWAEGGSCEHSDPHCDGRTFGGVEVCRGGVVQCEATEYYCVYDFGTHSLLRGSYVRCNQGMTRCESGSHSACAPNQYCRVNNCWTTGSGMSQELCWPHGEAYGCMGEPYETDQLCDSGTICFTPDERNTTGFACPAS